MAVLGLGALSTFAANVLARRLLPAQEFVDWAYLTSLVALFFSFSLLGSEQLIIRTARLSAEKIALSTDSARWIAGAFVAFVVVYVGWMDGRIFDYRLGVIAIPILMGIGAIQVTYQLERTRGRLLAAQWSFNAWKVALLPALALVGIASVPNAAGWAMGTSLVVGATFALRTLASSRGTYSLERFETDSTRVLLPFALSLGTLAVLNVVDRALIERTHDSAAFAAYFYAFTILVTPFGLLANYYGFSEAVRYRQAYDRRQVHRDVALVLASTGAMAACWTLVCFLLRAPLRLEFDAALWTALGALSVLRCVYSVCSAAMGVRGSPSAIYVANGLSLMAIGALATFATVESPTVTVIVAAFAGVWLVRVVAFLALLPGGRATQSSAALTEAT